MTELLNFYVCNGTKNEIKEYLNVIPFNKTVHEYGITLVKQLFGYYLYVNICMFEYCSYHNNCLSIILTKNCPGIIFK